jgi:hypothetical protein
VKEKNDAMALLSYGNPYPFSFTNFIKGDNVFRRFIGG